MLLIESRVFSKIKTEFSPQIKVKYPDLTFTTEQNIDSEPKFPTVYIHMLPSEEIGQDLTNETINGIRANFQIDVSDNQNNNRTKEVMVEVIRIMKTMRFNIQEMPYYEKRNQTYYSIARASRVIGSGDIL